MNKIKLNESEFKNLVENIVKFVINEDLYSQEAGSDEFLQKVKDNTPDKFALFYSIVKNKGLEFAKKKYEAFDPDVAAKKQKDISYDLMNKNLISSFVKSLPKNTPNIWKSKMTNGEGPDSAWFQLEGEILDKYANRYGEDKADKIAGLLTNGKYEEYYYSLLDQKFGEHVIEW